MESTEVGIAEALFDNVAEWQDELGFQRGSFLRVLDCAPNVGGLAPGWWLCADATGRRGIAPANRLRMARKFGPNDTKIITPRRFGDVFFYNPALDDFPDHFTGSPFNEVFNKPFEQFFGDSGDPLLIPPNDVYDIPINPTSPGRKPPKSVPARQSHQPQVYNVPIRVEGRVADANSSTARGNFSTGGSYSSTQFFNARSDAPRTSGGFAYDVDSYNTPVTVLRSSNGSSGGTTSSDSGIRDSQDSQLTATYSDPRGSSGVPSLVDGDVGGLRGETYDTPPKPVVGTSFGESSTLQRGSHQPTYTTLPATSQGSSVGHRRTHDAEYSSFKNNDGIRVYSVDYTTGNNTSDERSSQNSRTNDEAVISLERKTGSSPSAYRRAGAGGELYDMPARSSADSRTTNIRNDTAGETYDVPNLTGETVNGRASQRSSGERGLSDDAVDYKLHQQTYNNSSLTEEQIGSALMNVLEDLNLGGVQHRDSRPRASTLDTEKVKPQNRASDASHNGPSTSVDNAASQLSTVGSLQRRPPRYWLNGPHHSASVLHSQRFSDGEAMDNFQKNRGDELIGVPPSRVGGTGKSVSFAQLPTSSGDPAANGPYSLLRGDQRLGFGDKSGPLSSRLPNPSNSLGQPSRPTFNSNRPPAVPLQTHPSLHVPLRMTNGHSSDAAGGTRSSDGSVATGDSSHSATTTTTTSSGDELDRLSMSSVDSKDSDYQVLFGAAEIRLSSHSALDRLQDLQHDLQGAVARLSAYVTRNWRSKHRLEAAIAGIAESCRTVVRTLGAFITFASGAFVNASRSTKDARLPKRLAHLLRPLRDSQSMLSEVMDQLGRQGWHSAYFVRYTDSGNDALDQLIAISKTMPEDAGQVAAFIQGNARTLFGDGNRANLSPIRANFKSGSSDDAAPPVGFDESDKKIDAADRAKEAVRTVNEVVGSGGEGVVRTESVVRRVQSRPLPSLPKIFVNGDRHPNNATDSNGSDDVDGVVPGPVIGSSQEGNGNVARSISQPARHLAGLLAAEVNPAISSHGSNYHGHTAGAGLSDTESSSLFDDYDFIDGSHHPPPPSPPNSKVSSQGGPLRDDNRPAIPPKGVLTNGYSTHNGTSGDRNGDSKVPAGFVPGTSSIIVEEDSLTDGDKPTGSTDERATLSTAAAPSHEPLLPPGLKLCKEDRQIFIFYSQQVDGHIATLCTAIDAFLATVEQNGSPKVFVNDSKFVILAAHKLVYVADSVAQCVKEAAIGGRVKNASDQLCEVLKFSVATTKQAALQYPSVPSIQAMVDSIVNISHVAHRLKMLIQESAKL